MKLQFIKKNKAVLKFLLVFFGSYLLLALSYKIYLNLSESETYFPDYITQLVAKQSESLLQSFGYETFSIPYKKMNPFALH